jgi:YD repeat-containing protein
MSRWSRPALIGVALLVTSVPVRAQTTYHLRNANSSTSGLLQLNTIAANGGVVAIQSGDLKNHGAEDAMLKSFDTQGGPGSGIIPASSTLTFTIWMKKTATNNSAVVYPRVSAGLTWGTGVTLCGPTNGTTAISGSQFSYTVTCTTPASDINMLSTDRVWVSVGYHMTTGPGNHSMAVELDIEGLSFAATNTRVQVPNAVGPTISGLNPTSGPANWPVTISGTYFGAAQGTGSVKFNGLTAPISSWSTGSIQAAVPVGASSGTVRVTTSTGRFVDGPSFSVIPPPTLTSLSAQSGHLGDSLTISGNNFLSTQGLSTVTFNGTSAGSISGVNWSNTAITTSVPSGATSGSVIVNVSGQASNVLPFTVIGVPTLTSAVPASAQTGASITVTGSNFGASQGSSTIKFHGTTATSTYWSDTAIIAPVPAAATSGDVVVTVANQASNGLAFTVAAPGTISGAVTQLTGGAAISGASVQALFSGVTKGSATSAPNGAYSIPGLDPGTYEVWTSATGFSNNVRQSIVVTSSTTTTVNVTMSVPGSISGTITQSDGITPIVGAAIAMISGSTERGTTNTNGSGAYSIAGLPAGSYTIRAANVGNRTKEQAAAIAEKANTTVNLSLDAASAGSVNYAYDELGRLVQVTDQAGDSAIYRYDAVGNIIGIERTSSSTVAVSEFTPNKGPVGTTLTVNGTGFSATSSQDHVVFGCGTSCTVEGTITSATTTQLVTTVPGTAVTGTFTVTSPNGSAGSGGPFTITVSDAPTITGSTPSSGLAGTSVTISGTNFDPLLANNRVRFNASSPTYVTAVTPTSITTSVPTATASGPISVATPAGTAVSTMDFIIPPSPYAVTDVAFAGRIVAGGPYLDVPIATANKIGLALFSGTAGQRVSLAINAPGFCAFQVSILKPNGTTLIPSPCLNGGGFYDAMTLPTTGTYTILVDPAGTTTGTVTLTLYAIVDFSGTITPGGSAVNVITTVPGQNGTLTFSGTAQQRISLYGADGIEGQIFGCDVNVSIVRVRDNLSIAPATCMAGGGFIDTLPLPTTDTYAIVVDPDGMAIGKPDNNPLTITLTLYNVTDSSGSITADGTPVSVPLTPTRGQNGILSFTSTPNQRVSLAGSGTISGQVAFTCDVMVSIVRASDGQPFGSTCMEATGFIEPVTLGQNSEIYNVVVDPYSYAIGTMTLKLYTVPADATGTLTVNDPTPTFVPLIPGQNASYTFVPATNQQITVRITNLSVQDGSGNCVSVALMNGASTITSSASCASSFNLPQQSLTGNTTYTVKIDPVAATKVVTLDLKVTSP